MNKEQGFGIKVDLSYDMGVDAETYEEAVNIVKDIFLEEHKIELKDSEIDKENTLHDYIERQVEYWNDLETVENKLLGDDETLVDWLQCELQEIIRLYKENR